MTNAAQKIQAHTLEAQNAMLVAELRDMAKTLREILNGWDNWAQKGRIERAIDKARAALAKVQS